ncbi:O-methyltransferase [Tianweitania sediminis]|uniref:Uncharacterized protein n=1 Tax=Tianweitania sediminis TaxID=1502156 RepID=A0A8J7R1F1_9HYPH|nr:O-methyltransferase [Tianweitania sediminis]MBP0439562.1 hypothetical protein [Tianweitania sediminis]
MVESFRKIDYSIRPAKYAERLMLCDVFRRLSAFEPVESYKYVGFGSVWFSDFVLFHRALGIRDMLSIEQSEAARERINANKPFSIDLKFGKSTALLPDLDYSKRQFIWLDYDDPLGPEMLEDAAAVAARARSGSVLVISVQCVRAPEIAIADREMKIDPNTQTAEQRFITKFGSRRVPDTLSREDLSGWTYGELSRNMLLAEIDEAISTRKLADPSQAVFAKEICSFEYEDGAKMTSLVVIFYNEEERQKLESCAFEQMDFIPAGEQDKPVYIPTPKLTLREIRNLEGQLPLPPGSVLNIGHIPASEAKSFAGMYRYFPNFAVVQN